MTLRLALSVLLQKPVTLQYDKHALSLFAVHSWKRLLSHFSNPDSRHTSLHTSERTQLSSVESHYDSEWEKPLQLLHVA